MAETDALDDMLDDVEAQPVRERLEKLLDIGSIHTRIGRIRVHGRGGRAQVRIELDNGERIEFDPFGSYSSPAKMNFEVSSQVGSKPRLKKPDDVQEVARLIFWLGDHYESIATADRAWELGAEYLRAATLCDVDMSNQETRWRAFDHLRAPGTKHDTVLLDKGGSRYVRTQWVMEYIRARCDTGEAAAMRSELERHGWSKAGGEGRIKATHPEFPRSLVWAFLIVPEGWEDRDPDEAGDGR
jgi:hypothetical protein